MQKIFKVIIIIIFFLATACETTFEDFKKGLGGQKRTSTDEFLVKKKDPLVMPPQWRDLPEPGQSAISDTNISNEVIDIEELLQSGSNENSLESFEQNQSLEQSVLKKIKQK